MKKKNEHIIVHILIQLFFLLIVGVILLGPSVIIPSNTFFAFSLYGFSAVIFYYLIVNHGLRIFLLLGTLLSIILIAVFKPSTDISVLMRNFLWYFLIGLLVIFINKLVKNKSRVFIIASWFAGFAIVYILMTFMNVFIFGLYKTNENITFLFYIRQAIKVGGILGIGIGIGEIVAGSLFQNDLKTSKT